MVQVMDVEDCLSKLNTAVKEGTGRDCKKLLEDIHHFFFSRPLVEDSESGLAAAQLLDAGGLLDFLQKVGDQQQKWKDLEEPGKLALDIIQEFLPLETCLSLFRRTKSGKLRSGCFWVLSSLAAIPGISGNSDGFDVPGLTNLCFMELTQFYKLNPTEVQAIFVLLGALAEHFPEFMVRHSNKILDLYLSELKKHMDGAGDPKFPIICGSLKGLCGLLSHFTQSPEDDPQKCKLIFSYAYKVLNPNLNLSRYEAVRASLELIGKHGAQFAPHMYDNFKNLYEWLSNWCMNLNRENRKVAFLAMETFLTQVALLLVQYKDDNGKKSQQIFEYLLGEMRKKLMSVEGNARGVSVAIKGFGALAAPAVHFRGPAHVAVMFNEALQQGQILFLRDEGKEIDERVATLPSFLESLALIVTHMDEGIYGSRHSGLERLSVRLVELFPLMETAYHFLCSRALFKLFYSIHTRGPAYVSFLHRFVYQSLLRSCSHPIVQEAEMQRQTSGFSSRKPITYREYLPLWEDLIGKKAFSDASLIDAGMKKKEEVREDIFRELIQASIMLLQKLDFVALRNAQVLTRKFPLLGRLNDLPVGTCTNPETFSIQFEDK
ncbi:unnamed protein product [Darwinula stevensoni]|uniref:DNA-PKcs N-terminal domain-containing protein n=1 Tax=Darwinula stevensoni TaxID=69355 RepID=A0A7R9A886_9CRUS|nr:unnamed protein product [Darwinula stevensoni]CAG0896154.1 unnamed protein product [Darwinula stevensoni]